MWDFLFNIQKSPKKHIFSMSHYFWIIFFSPMFLSIKENGCNSWIDVPKDVILHVIIRWNNQLWFREYACTYKKFLEVLNQSWDNNSEIIFTKKIDGCVIGLTYQSISKLTFFMKVFHFWITFCNMKSMKNLAGQSSSSSSSKILEKLWHVYVMSSSS